VQNSLPVKTKTYPLCQRYFDMHMQYGGCDSNKYTGIQRLETTVKYIGRFGVTCPIFIGWLYGMRRPLALEHLNKLTKLGLVSCVQTHRSPDGRAYVLTHNGTKYAEDLLGQQLYFRSQGNPELLINQNTLMHDLICQFVLARGIQNKNSDGSPAPLWTGFVTEREFKRIYTDNGVRNVDGLVIEPDGMVSAIEIEHSFKNKTARQTILQKYTLGINQGIYQKIFLFSQDQRIFDDIKRLHEQLFTELPNRYDKKTKKPMLSEADVEKLQSAVIYRTKFCDEIKALFY
jgi:hypothetical protein